MITALIGLGNPGSAYAHTRHNIGFIVLDALAEKYDAQWKSKERFDEAAIHINGRSVVLIKPTTFMNNSGDVVPELGKRGIKAEHVVVVHDELELPFGKIALRESGSAKGHNGLRSLISRWGEQFKRLRVGIGRPADREEVPRYVLAPFSESIDAVVASAVQQLEMLLM